MQEQGISRIACLGAVVDPAHDPSSSCLMIRGRRRPRRFSKKSAPATLIVARSFASPKSGRLGKYEQSVVSSQTDSHMEG